MNRIKAVLFDIDGTLVDLHCLLKPFYDACDELGVRRISEETFYGELVGHRPVEKLKELLDDVPGERIERLYSLFKEKYINSVKSCRLLPGVKEVLQKLRNGGYKIGIVTTKSRDTARAVLNAHKIEYDALITASDVKTVKPDPEPIKKASEKLGIRPDECVMVGDHEFDVQSAERAGAIPVGVLTGVGTAEKLKKAGAEKVIKSLIQLPEVIEG